MEVMGGTLMQGLGEKREGDREKQYPLSACESLLCLCLIMMEHLLNCFRCLHYHHDHHQLQRVNSQGRGHSASHVS